MAAGFGATAAAVRQSPIAGLLGGRRRGSAFDERARREGRHAGGRSHHPSGLPRYVSNGSTAVSSAASTVRPVTDEAVNVGPLPLLDPSRSYVHVSPGVCDACADGADARRAWVGGPRVPFGRSGEPQTSNEHD